MKVTDAHYFIGIPVEWEIQEWLGGWQNELKREKAVFYRNWVHNQDLHITLKFLGPVRETALDDLLNQLRETEWPPSFQVTIGRLGIFGPASRPRVLWVGVEKNEALSTLQQKVEQVCAETGFPTEKRLYRPHITLAKKWNDNQRFPAEVKKRYNEQRPMNVPGFMVYQIHPAQNPKYEIISEINLK